MYCSRSLSASDRIMTLTNYKENDGDVMNTLVDLLGFELDTSELDTTEKELWYGDGLYKFQDTLDNEDNNMNVINQEPCDNNVKEILNTLNDEMINLRISDENIDHDIVYKNSPIVSQLTDTNQEENHFSRATNFNKDLNHNDNKVNNGDVLEDDLYLFNSNVYWYISPDLPLDPSIIAGKETSQNEVLKSNTVSTSHIY